MMYRGRYAGANKIDDCQEMQIIGEMFGGMENSL